VKLSINQLFESTILESHIILIGGSTKTAFIEIATQPEQESYAISDAQRRLWILSQFDAGSVAYNMPETTILNGEYDISALKVAIDATMDRHEILRTVFRENAAGEIRQWILGKEELNFEIDDVDFQGEENKEELVQTYIRVDANKEFDLENGPLFRAALLKIEEGQYVFFFNMHHIISDGWSMDVLAKDVLEFYQAHKENRTPALNDLRIQYKDYSAWQLSQFEEGAYSIHRSYWLDQLSGKLPVLDLPSVKQRPRVKTYNGHTVETYLEKTTSRLLKDYSQSHGGSLFMSLLALLKVTLYRYTSQTDIIIGSPMAGREHANLEDQIGFYVNTLALRSKLNPEESFNDFYGRVKENTLKSYDHQMYPFDRLVEELDLQRDTSRSAIFDVMLVLQNAGENTEGVDLTESETDQLIDHGARNSKFDLLINARELGDHISLSFEYNTDVYEGEMIRDFINYFKTLVSALLSNPDEKISRVGYLSASDKTELLETFNSTQESYTGKTVMELFEDQVKQTPDYLALEFEDISLSYRELNDRSNQLAHYLIAHHQVSNKTKVGVLLARSIESVISMMGVMKAGACYIPIDGNYPSERVSYIIDDSSLSLLISEESWIEKHSIADGLLLDINSDAISKSKTSNVSRTNELDDGSFVIYTSGSTGAPKGVEQTHRMLSNLIQWEQHHSGIDRSLKHLQFTSFSFDVSVQDCWSVLSSGGSLYVASQSLRLDFGELWSYIINKGIEVLSFPFSALQQLMVQNSTNGLKGHQLQHIVSSGEQLLVNHSLDHFLKNNPEVALHNHYGPSETHVVTSYTMSGSLNNIAQRPSIGKPISNSKLYILDDQMELVARGVIGELYIGGENLALGYLNHSDLTAEKFIDHPFESGKLLYKTGDLGKWLSDGNITFVGRADDQVKIRGYRVELGEIEHLLSKHPEVEESVVLVKENDQGEPELVAYLTSATEQNTLALRSYLKTHLPDYMLPGYFVQLAAFPLTSNGKVDKNSLPSPEGLGLQSGVAYVGARNEREHQLVTIWESVLQRDEIGVKDDFFELGGHSLKALRLINEYQRTFEVKLSINDLFVNTTLESHGELLSSSIKTGFIEIEPQEKQDSYPISDAQRRLWVLSQFEEGSRAYNMPGNILLNEAINVDYFIQAINATIDRHEVLRTTFRKDATGAEVRQWISSREELGFTIDYKDYRAQENKQELVSTYIREDSYQLFDLEKGPLLRAALLQVSDQEYIFYYNMHHIISDGWSMEVLSKDVFAYYEAYIANETPALKDLRIHYKDYSAWQLEQLDNENFKEHKDFWLDHLSGELPVLDLPSTQPRPRVKTHNGHRLIAHLDSDLVASLRRHSEQNGGSLFMGLLASWNVLLYHYTAQEDIIIGTPVAGRDHIDLQDQFGFYLNTLALRNKVNPEESFTDFYNRVKENTLQSYDHQTYPFDRLVDELDLQRDPSRSAVFDVMLILQNVGDKREEHNLTDEQLNAIIDGGLATSKCDLGINFEEVGDCLSLNVLYNPDVYHGEMIQSLISHFKSLLKVILDDPEIKISELDYPSLEEKNKLLVSFNDRVADYPKDKTIVDLFEAQVEKA
ncbi:MAG: amino acid adenylation domain-containing protein, partial [Flavobacteriales bacterium]|nr:amino acid adenylation domain-containing protein [Flavobacteriales bacterium]